MLAQESDTLLAILAPLRAGLHWRVDHPARWRRGTCLATTRGAFVNLPLVLIQPGTRQRVGDHDTALDDAFTRLAGYIYGNNSLDEKMAMTSPVFQEEGAPDDDGMSTATPVAQSAAGDGWTVSFFLSNAMQVEDAPTPDDTSIELLTEPETVRACLRYTGNNNAERRAEAKGRLLDVLLNSPRWRVVEKVSWAQYDQPFAIPFLKRHEAHVALKEKTTA